MMCAWSELIGVLPLWLREDVNRLGKERLQELRLRINAPPELVVATGSLYLNCNVTREDICFVVNTASQYSPWTATSMSKGYITAPGGHRIGLCGEAIYRDNQICGIREVQSINIRVARDFSGIGEPVRNNKESALILGAPGWGKTTLLRDMTRQLARHMCVAVVDERRELFPDGFLRGRKMDVLSGAPKTLAIEMVLRTMGPQWIAVDEITAREDCDAIVQAHGCGVHLLATAHGTSLDDFYRRSAYSDLLENRVFQIAYILNADKTFRVERINL